MRRSLQALAEEERRAQLDKERRERCSFHNFAVGALLAAWGFLMGMAAAPEPTDKIFAAHPRLMQAMNWLQIATCANGLILCLVGYGIRNQRRWAYALGTGSACLLLLGGVLFFIAFNRIGSGPTLVDGVAKIRLIRENFDLLIGLVEGGALLMFLVRYRQAQTAVIVAIAFHLVCSNPGHVNATSKSRKSVQLPPGVPSAVRGRTHQRYLCPWCSGCGGLPDAPWTPRSSASPDVRSLTKTS